MMLRIRLKELLEKKDRSLYWLTQETGTTYNNLHRLVSGKTSGVSFDTLDRICEALDCGVGEVLIREKAGRKPAAKKQMK